MNVLSLFSGIGGLDLGLERAGMTIAGQVEIDPWCRKVLAKHWPEVPRHDDVRTCVQWWGDRDAPDLVCGGFPCQPVSQAGKKMAQQDDRWLWPAFADVLRDLRPRFCLVENVPGLLGRGMGDVLGDLAALGFDAEWESLPAAAFGAPHIRDRVFIIGYRPPAPAGRPGGERRLLADPASGGERPDQHQPHRPPERQDGTDALRGGPALADPASTRRATGPSGTRRQARDDSRRPRPDGLGSQVADAERDGLEGCEHPVTGQGTSAIGRRLANEGDALADSRGERRRDRPGIFSRQRPAECGWWAAEPGVGRVAHGIPRRVDRLRGLGNAVVPQVAEHIGRLIMTAATEEARA